MQLKLYITITECDGNVAVFLAQSPLEREKQLIEYCRENWCDDDADNIPGNDDIVAEYYERYDNETYYFKEETIELDPVDMLLVKHEF